MAARKSDASRFREVAEAVRSLGMRTSLIIVGDVRVALSEPWGAERNAPLTLAQEQAEYVRDSTEATNSEKLKTLRKRSLRQLGRVLPDDQLLQLDGVL